MILVVLAARSLLFMAYVLRPPTDPVQNAKGEDLVESSRYQDTQKLYLSGFVTLALYSIILTIRQILNTASSSQYGVGYDVQRALGAVNENPAVSALGYDLLLCLAGLTVHSIMTA